MLLNKNTLLKQLANLLWFFTLNSAPHLIKKICNTPLPKTMQT